MDNAIDLSTDTLLTIINMDSEEKLNDEEQEAKVVLDSPNIL